MWFCRAGQGGDIEVVGRGIVGGRGMVEERWWVGRAGRMDGRGLER